jgi:hypothetical protein
MKHNMQFRLNSNWNISFWTKTELGGLWKIRKKETHITVDSMVSPPYVLCLKIKYVTKQSPSKLYPTFRWFIRVYPALCCLMLLSKLNMLHSVSWEGNINHNLFNDTSLNASFTWRKIEWCLWILNNLEWSVRIWKGTVLLYLNLQYT